MQLEKIVTDWYTLYSSPSKIQSLKNCIIYLSYSNLEQFKKAINGIINDKNLTDFQKEVELSGYEELIKFIKQNYEVIESDYLETEEIPFIEENNSFVVIVKEVKDVKQLSPAYFDLPFTREENDTAFVALLEDSQIFTVKDSFCYMIKEYEIPVFALNIKSRD